MVKGQPGCRTSTERPLNSAHEPRLMLRVLGGPPQGVFPHAQHPPARAAERPRHPRIPPFVAENLPPPPRRPARRPGCVPRAAMPETTIHEERHPLPLEYKIRPHPETSDFGFRTPNFNLPSPAGDPVRAQQPRQRQFRVPVAATANPRHHLGPLRHGENISHLFLTQRRKGAEAQADPAAVAAELAFSLRLGGLAAWR